MKTNIELLGEFERILIDFVKEENFRKNGVTKRTVKEYERLKDEILNRMMED